MWTPPRLHSVPLLLASPALRPCGKQRSQLSHGTGVYKDPGSIPVTAFPDLLFHFDLTKVSFTCFTETWIRSKCCYSYTWLWPCLSFHLIQAFAFTRLLCKRFVISDAIAKQKVLLSITSESIFLAVLGSALVMGR